MNINPALIAALAPLIVPLVIAIGRSVMAAAKMWRATNDERREYAITTARAWYDVADARYRLPDELDSYVKDELIPDLVERVYKQKKAEGEVQNNG